jgi:hypothetical protein
MHTSSQNQSDKFEYSYSQTVYVDNDNGNGKGKNTATQSPSSSHPAAPSEKTGWAKAKKLVVITLVLAPLTVLATFIFTSIFSSISGELNDVKTTFENFVVLSKEQRSAEAFALLTPDVQNRSSLATFEEKFAPLIAKELKNYEGIDWGRINIRTTAEGRRYADLRGNFKGSRLAITVRMYDDMEGRWLIEMFTFGRFSPSNFAKPSPQ